MRDLIITICADTRKVKFNRDFIGISGENLQGKIIVEFSNKADFQDGEARFEVEQKGKKYIINMTRNNIDKTYELPILSSLLSYSCDLKCQITITSQNSYGGNGVSVFKSEIFLLPCCEAVNATESIPEQYPSWITTANAKISEMNSLMEELEEKVKNGDFNGQTGATGPKGDKGEGIPTGGTIGQVLRKKSNADYDCEWGDGGSGAEPNNGTLTIQKNGTTVGTFGANQSENTTANITVPTKVSELTNDAGYTKNKGTVISVRVNGTTYTADNNGLVDLGTISGGTVYRTIYNKIY